MGFRFCKELFLFTDLGLDLMRCSYLKASGKLEDIVSFVDIDLGLNEPNLYFFSACLPFELLTFCAL